MLTLQDLEDDSLQFDLSAGSLEELFQWYQTAWNITQRKISKEYKRQHEVSESCLQSVKCPLKLGKTLSVLCCSMCDRTCRDERQEEYRTHTVHPHLRGVGLVELQQTGSDCISVRFQIRQQVEVEKKEEVAMEMSDLVVYCQPRSKEKDRFGKDTQTLITANNVSNVPYKFYIHKLKLKYG